MHNLSLVIFTILLQASAGLYVINALWHFKNTGMNSISHKEYRVALISTLLGIAGLIASFTHLGAPAGSINALKNLDSSWMSREILFTSLYLLSLGMIILIRKKLLAEKLSVVFRNLAFLSGLLLILSMIKVYSLPGLRGLDNNSLAIPFL